MYFGKCDVRSRTYRWFEWALRLPRTIDYRKRHPATQSGYNRSHCVFHLKSKPLPEVSLALSCAAYQTNVFPSFFDHTDPIDSVSNARVPPLRSPTLDH